MRKEQILIAQNISLDQFIFNFKHSIRNEKALPTSGFSGTINAPFFYIEYIPEQLNLKNIIEWWMPTILEGQLFVKGKDIQIKYFYDKKELNKALAYGASGFVISLVISSAVQLQKLWKGDLTAFLAIVLVGVMLSAPVVVITLISMYKSTDSKKRLEEKLGEIIRVK